MFECGVVIGYGTFRVGGTACHSRVKYHDRALSDQREKGILWDSVENWSQFTILV